MQFWTLSRSCEGLRSALGAAGGPSRRISRRQALALLGGLIGLARGLPVRAAAATQAPPAFAAETLDSALQRIGATGATPSTAVQLQLPDVAEDGSAVQMSLSTTLAARRALILVRKNRIPLVAEVEFTPGTLPFIATRIKMAEDSEVLALVEAEGRWYSTRREVKVTQGGCGG